MEQAQLLESIAVDLELGDRNWALPQVSFLRVRITKAHAENSQRLTDDFGVLPGQRFRRLDAAHDGRANFGGHGGRERREARRVGDNAPYLGPQ